MVPVVTIPAIYRIQITITTTIVVYRPTINRVCYQRGVCQLWQIEVTIPPDASSHLIYSLIHPFNAL